MTILPAVYSVQDIAALPLETERFEKISEYLKQLGGQLVLDMEQLQLTAEHRFEVAKQFVVLNPIGCINLGSYRLTPDHYLSLAMHSIENAQHYYNVISWQYYPLSPEQRFTILSALAAKFPLELVTHLDEESGLTEEQFRKIYKVAAKEDFFAILSCPIQITLRPCHIAFCTKSPQRREDARNCIPPRLLEKVENYLEAYKIKVEGSDEAEESFKAQKKIVSAIVDSWLLCLTEEELAWISEQTFFEEICSMPEELWPSLVSETIEISSNVAGYRDFASQRLLYEILKFPLLSLHRQGVDPASITNMIGFLATRRDLMKDVKNVASIYRTFNSLSTNTTLNPLQKQALLHEFIREPMYFMQKLTHLQILLDCNNSVLAELPTQGVLPLKQLAFASFQELLPAVNMTNYERTFAQGRVPEAIMVYGARLSTLNNSDRNLGLDSLSEYMNSVFDGTYKQNRYDLDRNSHLATIASTNEALVQKWAANWESAVLDLMPEGNNSENMSMFQWLREQLLEEECIDQLDEYPHLLDFLQGNKPNALKELVDLKTSVDFKQMDANEQRKIVLQYKLCQLALKPTGEKALELLKELKKSTLMTGFPDFLRSVTEKIVAIETESVLSKLNIVFTDSYEDITLIGHEGRVSCQNFDGNPIHNIALLGLLQNGQTKLIAVKNEDGVIVARATVRLLWDGQRPVIFLAGIYTNQKGLINTQITTAIHNMIGWLGKDFDCPVTHFGEGIEYRSKLESLDGVAPYDYLDEMGGLVDQGIFKFRHRVKLLNSSLTS